MQLGDSIFYRSTNGCATRFAKSLSRLRFVSENSAKFPGWGCAITKTKVQVKFNKAVDSVKGENFTIAGAVVESAKLAEDKKTVELAVTGLKYETEYTVVATDVLVDGKTVDPVEAKFKTPAITDLYELELETNAKGDSILADGLDNLIITAKLKDKVTGEVDKNADNVLIAFSTTRGNLANDRVTVQDGIAQVALTSEPSDYDVVAKVDAQIIEASGDYKDLIGKVVGTKNVHFKLDLSDVDQDSLPVLLNVTSTSADRVIAYFDKEVTVADFLEYDKAKDLVKVEDGIAVKKENVDFKVSQDNFKTTKKVLGLKVSDKNPKAIEIILTKDEYLEDNKEVQLEVSHLKTSTGDKVIQKSFVLVDTRKPEATFVEAENLNTVVVKFSKPIHDAKYAIDGRLVAIKSAGFGDFDPATRSDKRHILTVKTDGFMSPGLHSIQLSAIKDFAGITDPNNISANQSLNFTVYADETVPTAKVSVESPEQFRVNFNKAIVGLEKVEGQEKPEVVDKLSDKQVQFQVLNKNGNWVTIKSGDDDEFLNEKYPGKDKDGNQILPELEIHKITASEYVFELKADWTRSYDTEVTKKNYYNDQYRLFIPAGSILYEGNGKTNEEISLLLNDPIMKAPDTKSPEIKGIKQVGKDVFHVEMSKPVKLGPDIDGEPNTPPQGKETPIPTAEFVGKNKDGEYVTIRGIIDGYATDDHKDTVIIAKVDKNQGKSIQEVVDEGGDVNWEIIVRSISDDVGNTAATLTQKFKVTPSEAVEENFRVATNGIKGYLNEAQDDTIEIVFTSEVKTTGTVGNALSPSNYTVNGVTLPKDTLITFTEAGKKDPDKRKITIHLPDGTLSAKYSNVITLSKYLESNKGLKLSGDYSFTFYVEEKIATNALDAINSGTYTAADLTKAGVSKVDETKFADYKAAIDAARAEKGKALTLAEVQAEVDKVNTPAVDPAEEALKAINSGTYTAKDLKDAGVNNVEDAKFDDYKTAIDAAKAAKKDDLTLAEVQAEVDKVNIPAPTNKVPEAKQDIDQEATVGTDLELTVDVLATDEDGDTLSFVADSSSSNAEDVATVKIENGKLVITPVKAGEATISVKVTDGKEEVTVSFKVTVENAATNKVPEAKQDIDQDATVGTDLELTVDNLATDEDGDTLSFVADSSSSDAEDVATVKIENGKLVITPVKAGEATISVKVTDGKEDVTVSFKVTVQ
ncbi:sugar-binding domain protein [Brevibacillus ruminantium]|uniref:Sugar-binding domain protein n=1 Tax=Brevibacillus ruminantium TaxID=2950604 RepID=A0ABY4WDW0_9BACL|nr:sugar-binding domain protein [Brevibacillus ruminantium]USG65361.1 sugar-binding domain protein [Brevibacillus ruminantium]